MYIYFNNTMYKLFFKKLFQIVPQIVLKVDILLASECIHTCILDFLFQNLITYYLLLQVTRFITIIYFININTCILKFVKKNL